MTGSSNVRILNVVKIAGVFIAWAIGSGSVTGQASLQYFCAYGAWGFLGIVIDCLLHLFLLLAFFSIGHKMQFENPLAIYTYFSGEKIGKIFQVLSIILLYSAPVVMISGFGASLNQHFGVPTQVGSILLGVLCLITILLGLKKLVNITGSIGPFMIMLTIAICLIYLFNNIDGLSEGIKEAPQIGIAKIAPYWWLAGLYYTTCTPFQSAPFFAATAKNFDVKAELKYGAVLGVILYGITDAVMACALFSNIEVLSEKMIPNLYIANLISPALGFVFIIVIFLAIYSSCVPAMFTLCASFKKEKTPGYNKFAVCLVTASVLCSMLLPFDRLLGLVYGTYGVLGGILVIFIFARQMRDRKEEKLKNV